MTSEIRIALGAMCLQGLLSQGTQLSPESAARLALAYADALIEAARPGAPQAAERPPLAEAAPASDAERDRERPSAAPEERRLPPAPALPTSSRGEVAPPAPRDPPPLCEAPECPHEGRPRFVEALVDGRKRDVPIWLCDVHFVGIPGSIVLEWHRAFRKASAHGKESARAV